MIFLVGDTHGLLNIQKVTDFFEQETESRELSKDDFLIILGDAGICWDDATQDEQVRKILHSLPVTTLFVDGNHDNHDILNDYPITEWHGGKIHEIDTDIIHLMRGQVFEIEGKTFFTFGGADSVDKSERTEGINWWAEEMPSEAEYQEGYKNLNACDYVVDYVLTHTAPSEIIEEMGWSDLYDDGAELRDFLADVAFRLEFKEWYFGHWHEDLDVDEYHCLMERIVKL